MQEIITLADWKPSKDFQGLLEARGFWHDGHPILGFIQTRPAYCDRGHFVFNVDGVPGLDWADAFPRYFMDINRAIQEATDWINWNNHQSQKHGPKPFRPQQRQDTDK